MSNIPLGNRAELRTLASQKLDEMLKELGMSEDEFRTLNRWEKVAEIRQNMNQQGKTGLPVDQNPADNELNSSGHSNLREIDEIIGLKSRDEAVVKFRDSQFQEIVKMDELKKNYSSQLIQFYEDQYF